jgi:hypothetical protein
MEGYALEGVRRSRYFNPGKRGCLVIGSWLDWLTLLICKVIRNL